MRKLKLLFELVFIFVLPLIFMCFYLNIETVYTYDNDGNYQDSSKQITFDTIEIVNEIGSSTILGYNYSYFTWEEFIFGVSQVDDLNPNFLHTFYVDYNKINFSYLYHLLDDNEQHEYIALDLFSIIDTSSDTEFSYSILWNIDDYGTDFYTLGCVDVSSNVLFFS